MTEAPVSALRLNVEMRGTGSRRGTGEAILLLHGFTGSAATWDSLDLPYRLVAVDLPGHGRSVSPADSRLYRPDRTVRDLLAVLDDLRLERVHLLGYSMGGRIALHLALAARERVRSLVLESASPGIEDPVERSARVASDEALATLIEREGLETFVDRWERSPLFASQARLAPEARAALRAQRLAGSATGLAHSLRGAGAGAQESLWARLHDLAMPVLLVAGELDEKYCDIARRMKMKIPDARLRIVPDAGHAVHLEAPDAFRDAVASFLMTEGKVRDDGD